MAGKIESNTTTLPDSYSVFPPTLKYIHVSESSRSMNAMACSLSLTDAAVVDGISTRKVDRASEEFGSLM